MRDYNTLRKESDNRFYVDNDGAKEECKAIVLINVSLIKASTFLPR